MPSFEIFRPLRLYVSARKQKQKESFSQESSFALGGG
jgi:hypothetical protein